MGFRASQWCNVEGEEASIASIAEALRGHVSWLVERNIDVYTSNDMKVGISLTELSASKLMLLSLLQIDPEGDTSRNSMSAWPCRM